MTALTVGRAEAPRLLLHAYKVELTHPGTGKPVAYRAAVPRDFKAFWAACK